MPKAKKLKRNSGEAVEVGEPDPSSGTGPRKIPAENRNGHNSELNGECDIEEMYTHIVEDEDGGMRIGDIYIAPPPKPALTFDSTGPRMIITHIVNTNFKSYAGVQYLGPFHKSFTSIIGPNGSGKSNVIDAMLFVFGYRANRIRSKKIGALIHTSKKNPNMNSASVEVHFAKIIDEEGDNFSVVPDSKIVVGRTGFRDNTSYYTLDGKKAQFKQVAKVLRTCGIDLDHNRFLILQGEVELISMMKPKAMTAHESGMLEYLEDIIGTTRYKEPIEKINERVESLTEARKEKLNRVRAVENEKAKLEQPMKEAVELINLTNQALRIRNMMLQKYGHEVGKLIETRKETKATIEAKLASIDAKLGDISNELNEKTAVLKEGSKKYELLHKKKESVKEKLQTCKNKAVTLNDDTTQLNQKKKNLDQLLKKEKRALIELELIPEKNTREIADCEKLLLKVNENKRKADAELEAVVAGVSAQTQSLRENQTRLKAKLIGLKEIVNEANESYSQAKNELDICTRTEQKETEKLAKMKEEYEKANKDLGEKKKIQQQLSSTLPENERELTQLQSKLQDMRREEASVLSESVLLLSQVEASRQVMTANRSRGRVLDSLMREKQNGNIPGIFGRLGDLGGIDLKYDVAISTCCGALDNIVVDTVETAQACVEYLKRNDVGRATFIALNKQTHLKQHYESQQTFPENVPRMFNLITVKDERVLPAFYYALRDTLVANDLEQATRIAYGRTRYRMVTLKGEVIEIAGTMAGGGKSTMRGRMSSAVQQDTSEQDHTLIEANERKLTTLEQRLSDLRSQLASMEDTMTTLQRTVQEGKRTLGNVNTELRSLTVQVPLIKDKIKMQENKVSCSRVEEGRKELLESVVAEEKKRLDKAQSDAGEVEKEIQGVDAQISAIAGGRIKDMQKKVNELTKKINKINTEMTKLKVAIDASIRNAQQSKDKIASMEADFTETEKTLENLGNQKKQLTLDTAELTKEMEEIEEEISEGSGEFSGLKKEISKLNNKQTEIKSERIVVANELSAEEKAIKDCEVKLPVWEREIAELKLEDAGEDDTGIAIPDLVVPEPLERHSPEELDAANVDELRAKYKLLKQRIGDVKPNIGAVKEYRAKEASFLERAAALESVTTRRNELRASYDNLRRKRQTDFLAGFNIITGKLKEMYQMITLGGDAELELVDSLDPFTEGIIFSVRPPNKSWKNISNLSGGEKTLSSLALVFALHYYRPTPLYVMDEIDAALDFKNVSIVANYIQERTRNAQFVIISLRYIMFEACNRLVGIYKVRDCTHSVAVENVPVLDEAAKCRDRHI